MFFYTACFAAPSVLFWDILFWIKKLEINYTLLFFLGFSSIRRNLFGANRILRNSWQRTTFLTQIHLDMLCDKPYYDVIEVILVLMFNIGFVSVFIMNVTDECAYMNNI